MSLLILISPSKKMDLEAPGHQMLTKPQFQSEIEKLVSVMKKKSTNKLKELMSISDNLAELNRTRYEHFDLEFGAETSRSAISAFQGDVYVGLDGSTLGNADLEFAQKHVLILSGLYGLIRPLDSIQAYRLEMGVRLKTPRKNNLYEFWSKKITENINSRKDTVVINLASNEYFKAVDLKKLNSRVINVSFREYRGDELKFISFNAKKARGLMTRYIIDNKLTNPEELKGFDYEGYSFAKELSDNDTFSFIR